jgi:hypothetical protein
LDGTEGGLYGGPAAFSIGHGNPEVNATIASQLAQVAGGYRYLFSSDPLEIGPAFLLLGFHLPSSMRRKADLECCERYLRAERVAANHRRHSDHISRREARIRSGHVDLTCCRDLDPSVRGCNFRVE